MASASELSLTRLTFDPPSLQSLADLFQQQLASVFEHVQVTEVSQCPDLTQPPFDLNSPGLGTGDCAILDIGHVSNLLPRPNYSLPDYFVKSICDQIDLKHNQLSVVGAGAGPFRQLNTNCELIPNVQLTRQSPQDAFVITGNRTRGVSVVPDGPAHKRPHVHRLDEDRFSLLANMFVSNGHSGPALKIIARKRVVHEDEDVNGSLPALLRSILNAKYSPQNAVSMGGIVLIRRGYAKMHIMPDFSSTPLNSEQEVNDWLSFFDFEAPLFCGTVFHSHDSKGLGLRLEHTHGYSLHENVGGHFHHDQSPEVIEYEAYLRPVNHVYRENMQL